MAFTVQQLFDRTIGMLGISATNAKTYQETFYQQTNAILADCFKIENTNRLWKSLAELTSIPSVTALIDSIDYQEELLQVMANGCAMFMAMSDDDTIKTQYFNIQYEEGKSNARKMIPTVLTDYFSAEDTEIV